MAITQALNNKANVKKSTTNDIPFSPAQPAISSYYATSTAGQTSIANLGFTINTSQTGATDNFWLFVDGKKLDLGTSSTNDYYFTAVAADGSSSSIAFNQSLVAGLNIQAFKLGLKPEIQFGMDNRFTQLYANQGSGFQGFVSQTDSLMTATSSSGTPPAGQFYSSIVGRAPMVDLSQDLKPRMGVERIITQQIQQIQNEFGPNGEPVWGTPNDTFGQIRFVGQWGVNSGVGTNGQLLQVSTQTDFLEITFYGTGLNIVGFVDSANRNWTYSVDGGSVLTTTAYPTSGGSTVINARNYSTNVPLNVVSGLSLGIHTVKMIASITNSHVYGFEILNESSSVKVQPGIGYVNGQKLVLPAQSAFSYSAPVTGTRGGRVLVYQKADGTIAQSFQATNAASATLTSADHTNEEVARVYAVREFGAGRAAAADDFSGSAGSGTTKAFTLDDGTTTFIGAGGTSVINGIEAFTVANGINTFSQIVFVGTGLDIMRIDNANGGADTFTVSIDGASAITLSTTGSTALRQQKIVSGLPYGTHTVRFTRTSTPVTYDVYIKQFVVYQPKTPALPSGAIQLGTYNVMANFVATTDDGHLAVSQGTLFKSVTREFTYTGTWTVGGVTTTYLGGNFINNSGTVAGDQLQYTFFGTGFEVMASNSGTGTYTVSLNGTLMSTANFTINGTGTGPAITVTTTGGNTFTASTGTFGIPGAGYLQVSGLSLAKYSLVLNKTSTSANYGLFQGIGIITPIHSVKSNIFADLQNTLPVGSNAISDDRKVTPVKDILPVTKVWAQAVGITQNPTVSASAQIPVPDMSVTVKTSGGRLRLYAEVTTTSSTTATTLSFQFYVDGVAVGGNYGWTSNVAGFQFLTEREFTLPVAPGTHKVDLYWSTNVGTWTATNGFRLLLVEEV